MIVVYFEKQKYRFYMRYMIKILVTYYCKGEGIEIGPGDHPYCDPSTTLFLDKYNNQYPDGPKIDIQADASTIIKPDNTFDYLLSSHYLEHQPDTLKVLYEWKRIVKPGGTLFLILPHGRRCFDNGRILTTLAHHLDDYKKKVDVNDRTHWAEFERFSIPQFKHRWLSRAKKPDGSFDFKWIVTQGHLHYHVWAQNEMLEILKYIGCDIHVVWRSFSNDRIVF